MNTLKTNFRIFSVIVARDTKILTSNILKTVLDCIAPLFVQVITFGHLFPLIGMPIAMVAPVYLGSMLPLLMQLGFSMVMRTSFDLEFKRFIDYHVALPLPKRWLFAAYAVNHIIEVALVTVPLYSIGILLLHQYFGLSQLHVVPFAFMYLLILIFLSTLFLAIGYSLSLNSVMDNVWPRLLVPLWWLSSALMVWKQVYAWQPLIGYTMLLSPMTYVAEGMRSALLGTDQYIAWPLCALALCGFIIVNIAVLRHGLHKKLDPV